MSKLILMRGLPASGKSTRAREIQADTPGSVIVSRDEIRLQLYGVYSGSQIDESNVTEVETAMVMAALRGGKTVIVDAQHLYQKYINRWQKLGYPVEIEEMHSPLEDLRERNASREDHVPESYLRKQWDKFTRKDGSLIPSKLSPEDFIIDYKYQRNPRLLPAYIFDIDGTLAHNDGHRSFYDYSKVLGDKPMDHVINVANSLEEYGYYILAVSGRDESCREDTLKWLRENRVKVDALYMRSSGDQRADSRVKMEILRDRIAPSYRVLGAFDDRPSVVRTWQKMGIPTFALGDQGKEF